MAGSTSRKKPPGLPADDVDAYLAQLEHPFRDGFVALRRAILAADAGIAEGIKWNVPSFRTSEWFATMHLRAKAGFGVGYNGRVPVTLGGVVLGLQAVNFWLPSSQKSKLIKV